MAQYSIEDTTLTGIADAIRSKTGGTDAILVSDMATAIAGIPTGGGGSGEAWYKYGSFNATSNEMTVSVDFGEIPDIILFYCGSIPVAGYIMASCGFSSKILDKFSGTVQVPTPIITAAAGLWTMNNTKPMEGASDNDSYGHIRNVTATGFTVGGSVGKLNTTSGSNLYAWRAYGGIV